MGILLFPWMIIWILISINPTLGATAGILSVGFTPLFCTYFQSTLYEKLKVFGLYTLEVLWTHQYE